MEQRTKFIIVVALQVIFLLGMIGAKQFIKDNGEKILLRTEPIDPQSLFAGDYVMLNYNLSLLSSDSLSFDSSEFRRGYSLYLTLEKGEKYAYPVKVSAQKPAEGLYLRGKVQNIENRLVYNISYTYDGKPYTTLYENWYYDQGEPPYGLDDKLYVHINKANASQVFWIERYYDMNTLDTEDSRYAAALHEKEGINEFRAEASIIRLEKNTTHLRTSYGIETYYVPQGKGRDIEKYMWNRSVNVDVEVSVAASGEGQVTRLFINDEEVKY